MAFGHLKARAEAKAKAEEAKRKAVETRPIQLTSDNDSIVALERPTPVACGRIRRGTLRPALAGPGG